MATGGQLPSPCPLYRERTLILITAGTQLPFERLATLALRCARALPEEGVVYQAGPGGEVLPDGQEPTGNLQVKSFIEPEQYQQALQKARCVITHAGMGNLLHLLEREIPFLVLPRLMQYGEHRNDHQVDTARAMHERFGIEYYLDSDRLLERLLSRPLLSDGRRHRENMLKRRRELASQLQDILSALDR